MSDACTSPVSGSAIVRLKNTWTCVLCDVTLHSHEQMEIHRLGQRHCYTVADIKARGMDYHEYIFWTSVKNLIPNYPSMFPSQSDVIPPLIEPDVFFKKHYLKLLPHGVFYCEVCAQVLGSAGDYSDHVSSTNHRNALVPFVRLEVDYFQPVLFNSQVFFIGLVSRSLETSLSFFSDNQVALTLQWKVSNRPPSPGSYLMQASPDRVMECLTVLNV